MHLLYLALDAPTEDNCILTTKETRIWCRFLGTDSIIYTFIFEDKTDSTAILVFDVQELWTCCILCRGCCQSAMLKIQMLPWSPSDHPSMWFNWAAESFQAERSKLGSACKEKLSLQQLCYKSQSECWSEPALFGRNQLQEGKNKIKKESLGVTLQQQWEKMRPLCSLIVALILPVYTSRPMSQKKRLLRHL